MESDKSFVDVQEVVNEIRARVRARMGSHAPSLPASDIGAIEPSAPCFDLTGLHHATGRVMSAQALVGELPPRPPGLRARLGAALVGIVRRMLFWYTPQIRQFQYATAQAIQEHESIAASLGRELAALNQSVQSLERSVSALEREVAQIRTSVKQELDGIVEPIRAEVGRLAAEESGLPERISRLEEAAASGSIGSAPGLTSIADVQRRLEEVVGFTGDRLADLRTKLDFQSRQVKALIEETRPGAFAPENENDERGLDALYARFEDIFRGTREDIKERVRVYVPVLSEASIGGPGMPVLDIGCGRGEWLEVLRENGIHARGVDINAAMVARCEVMGLPVSQADGVEYLKSLPPDSLGAVTAFHVLEHLPFEKLIELLDEAARVLKVGGVAIFETPNPGNLLVGANTFYLDPTHRSPLPAALLKFLAETRGFSGVEIWPLHSYPDGYKLPEDQSGVTQRLNELLYGPQDYGIIGRLLHRE